MAFMKFSKGKPLLLVPNGVGDGSAYFDGSSYCLVNVPSNMPVGNEARTFACRLYLRAFSDNWSKVIDYGNRSYAESFALGIYRERIALSGYGGENDYYSDYYLALKTWYHLVLTYENNLLIAYANGIKVWEQTTNTLTTNNVGLGIGCNALDDSNEERANANIKDVLVYNRALSADEVTTLYNKGKVADGLVLNVPLTYGQDDDSIFSSKSFVYDHATLTTSSGFDEWGYPIRYDVASECGINFKGSYYVPNDTDTLVLYQPKANDTEVVNYAKGASRLLYEPKNYGVTVADGKLQFDGEINSYIEFPSNSFPVGCFDTLGEFTVDMWFDNQKTSTCCLFGTTKGSNGSSRMDWLTNINTGEVAIGGFKNLKNSGEPYTKFRITLEVWNDNGNSVFASYVNGKKQNSGSWTLNSRSYALCLGYDNETSDRYFQGNMAMFSIRSKADHKGVDFEVKENPYA